MRDVAGARPAAGAGSSGEAHVESHLIFIVKPQHKAARPHKSQMKFGREWADVTTSLPPTLARLSFSYKAWKKRSKSASATFLQDLRVECTRIDVAFRRLAETAYGGRRACPWMCQDVVAPAFGLADILAFADLQRTCVTKICKRYDKKNGVSVAVAWLQGVKARGLYAFLGGALVRRLAIDVHGATECPVCLDADVNVVLDCGHAVCMACFDQVYKLAGKGTLHNLIAVANMRAAPPKCPVCRRAAPMASRGPVQKYQIIGDDAALWNRGI
jgi:hypothetical protein